MNSLHCVIRRGLVIPVPTAFGLGGDEAGFPGVLTTDGRAVGTSFFGEGVGGSTEGSLALNCLTGVLGRTGLARTGRTLSVVEGLWSSGNASKFNRRRTSYSRQRPPKNTQQGFWEFGFSGRCWYLDVAGSASAGDDSHAMTTPSNLLLERVVAACPAVIVVCVVGRFVEVKVDEPRRRWRRHRVGGFEERLCGSACLLSLCFGLA